MPATQTISVEFDGIGGWAASAVYFDEQLSTEFDGVGGWSESDVQYGVVNTGFAGVGNLTVFVQPSLYFPLGNVAWSGSGALAVSVLLPHTQLLWRSAGAQFIILDATSGVAYNSALMTDQPATLLFNIGQPIPSDYTQFSLTITRPDGSSYTLTDPNLYQIGEQPWISLGWVPTPYFRTGYYLAYSFTQDELSQPGLWMVTYRGPANAVSMAFILPPLARVA